MRFLQRVVPTIAQNTPGAGIDTNDLVKGFLQINQRSAAAEQRRRSRHSRRRPGRRCCGARGSRTRQHCRVESRFADFRTYFYQGKEIDRQVHLGFDLASLQHAPVPAANRGIVDLRQLSRHLRQLRRPRSRPWRAVAVRAPVDAWTSRKATRSRRARCSGRTGTTGLAGGDHLHFTMLVNGVAVNPVEWWDPHWMEDRVFRKIREAGGQAPTLK